MREPKRHLGFRLLSGLYAIVRLGRDATLPAWATNGDFTSVTRTADELSIVCQFDNLPVELHSQPRWVCLKLEGPFAFSETGVLLSFIQPLSNRGVPIFAISTYDTDYVLIQEEYWGAAHQLLEEAGHELRPRHESCRQKPGNVR